MKPYKLTALGAPFGCRNVVDRESGLVCGHVWMVRGGRWNGEDWAGQYLTGMTRSYVARLIHNLALAERKRRGES